MLNKIRRHIAIAVSILAIAMRASVSAPAQGGPGNFSFRAINGEAVSSESLRGEVVVLAFGASWLPLTRDQIEAVEKLADQYAGSGVAVYWGSPGSESPESKNYVSDCQ